ncbi:hypothetical protein [Actinomadura formosensis]|nr:hypothetical protein [Actinomadura formosensis]
MSCFADHEWAAGCGGKMRARSAAIQPSGSSGLTMIHVTRVYVSARTEYG